MDPGLLYDLFEPDEAFIYPVKARVDAIMADTSPEQRAEMMSGLAAHWMQRLAACMGSEFEIRESPGLLLLCLRKTSRRLLKFSQDALTRLHGALGAGREELGMPRVPIILLPDIDTYYSYISHYYEDGEYGGSAGVQIHRDIVHIATYDCVAFRVIPHELSHAVVESLPLPRWLNEGVAQMMEEVVGGSQVFRLTHVGLAEMYRYWHEHGLQRFWSGHSFSAPGEQQRMSYMLANVMARNLVSDYGRKFMVFVRKAHYRDAGAAAAVEVFGCPLDRLVAATLGPGDWVPRPPEPA